MFRLNFDLEYQKSEIAIFSDMFKLFSGVIHLDFVSQFGKKYYVVKEYYPTIGKLPYVLKLNQVNYRSEMYLQCM